MGQNRGMVQVAFSFMVVKESFRRKQAGLACMIYEALLTCVPLPSLPSPFSLRLCGIIAGLLWLQKGRLAKYALPGSPAHAVSAALNPPFTIWYFLASKHLHLRNAQISTHRCCLSKF